MAKTAAAFFIVVLLAFGWRCVGITFDSLWLDEGYQTIVDAYGRPLPDFTRVPERPFIFNPGTPASPAQMLQNFRNVDPLTPPLYQLLLNRWIAVFGGSDLTLRLLSAVISAACVGSVFWVANKIFGLKAAVVAGLVQAFSPFDIYYGQEVRMYALVELSATLSAGTLILLLMHFIRGPARPWAWALYVVSTWALINSHYTGLFLCLFEGMLGLAFVVLRRSWRLLGILLTSWIMVAVLWIPWLKMFFQAAQLRTASFYVARKPSFWWPFYALFVKIPVNWIVFLSGKQVVAPAIPVFGTSALGLLMSARAMPHLERRAKTGWVLTFLWALVPAVALWAIDVMENHKVVEISRYVIATAPAIYILAGVGFAAFLTRRNKLAIGIFALHLIFCAVNNIAHVTVMQQREPWRDMARLVEQRVPPDQLVLVAQHYNIVCLDRYLKVPYRQVGVATGMPKEHIEKVLSGVDRFALVTAQEGEGFTALVPPEYRIISESKLSHGLHLRLYQRN